MLKPLPSKQIQRVFNPALLEESEEDMTLCIAALARDEDNSFCIVTCSDKLESNEQLGSEIAHKFLVLSPDLFGLYSDSPARAKELQTYYQEHFKTHSLEPSNMAQQLEVPLTQLKRRLAESYVGRRLGISYAELLKNRKKWADYLENIERHKLGVDLLVGGFVGTRPLLYQTLAIDPEDPHDKLEALPHWGCIGSAYWTAAPTLRRREQDQNTNVWNTLYNLYEAKKQSEVGPGVGKKITRMFVIRPRAPGMSELNAQVVTGIGLQHLESLYKLYGPKPAPHMYDMPEDSFMASTPDPKA